MMAPHAGLERRVLAALDATPARIPVVIGGCGTGRTTLLHVLADRLGRDQCQYVDVERAASTPERFHQAFAAASFHFLDDQIHGASPEPHPLVSAANHKSPQEVNLLACGVGLILRPAAIILSSQGGVSRACRHSRWGELVGITG